MPAAAVALEGDGTGAVACAAARFHKSKRGNSAVADRRGRTNGDAMRAAVATGDAMARALDAASGSNVGLVAVEAGAEGNADVDAAAVIDIAVESSGDRGATDDEGEGEGDDGIGLRASDTCHFGKCHINASRMSRNAPIRSSMDQLTRMHNRSSRSNVQRGVNDNNRTRDTDKGAYR
jgi:hypothetical protein